MRLVVRYRRASDFVRDYDAQMSRGGLLVRVEPTDEMAQFSPVSLSVEIQLGVVEGDASIEAQIVQVFTGVGVAVTFATSAISALGEIVDDARALGDAPGDDTTFTIGGERDREEADEAPEDPAAAIAIEKVREATGPAKVAIALRGGRDERMLIMRENNPQLHGYVLRNPGLQLDEVLAIAKMRTVAPDLLKQIAERRDWLQRSDIALALVRNPKTPITIAVRLLDSVSAGDVRALAKDTKTRAAIQSAARKKVIGS